MIPADVATHLRLTNPPLQQDLPQQVAPAQKIADVLSNLIPGQRILAEVQAQLPNGTYRAIVAQREITLALPFAAKAGDSLELEVTESDGKITLAFVANKSSGEQASKLTDSAATTLSQTGKLIGDLLGGISDQGKRAAPAPLNGNLPLVDKFPDQAANLAPVLKEALTKSGVFYEAHQARWVAGGLPTESLKQEPQGKFATTPAPTAFAAVDTTLDAKTADSGKALATAPAHTAFAAVDTTSDAKMGDTSKATATAAQSTAQNAQTSSSTNANPIPRDLVPIVQQQLDALATQNYAWQGQIWPGQQMHWEIGENTDGSRAADNESIARWQTRLKLSLPTLGGIDAILRLNPAGEVSITVTADSTSSETLLRDGTSTLSEQMAAAGLNLTQLLVEHGQSTE